MSLVWKLAVAGGAEVKPLRGAVRYGATMRLVGSGYRNNPGDGSCSVYRSVIIILRDIFPKAEIRH
jgi:hypothetical protein